MKVLNVFFSFYIWLIMEVLEKIWKYLFDIIKVIWGMVESFFGYGEYD